MILQLWYLMILHIRGLMARPISAEAKEDLKYLLPGIHIMVDLSREKVRTQQNQEMVVSYTQSCLLAKKFTSC